MTHEEVVQGLKELGFNGGWVITGNEITLWENELPQPTESELIAGLALVEQHAVAKAAARQAVLDKLGLTADEVAALLG
jgi:hypothetical protein